MGDAERTKDRRQTCRKLGSGVLGARMETHTASLLLLFFFSLFKILLLVFLLLYSLKSLCPMFSLIFLKVLALRLALSHVPFKVSVSRDTQTAAAAATFSQAASSHPIIHPKSNSINPSCPLSVTLLFKVVNQEVEQHFLGRGMLL
jgi:hypothetical protein